MARVRITRGRTEGAEATGPSKSELGSVMTAISKQYGSHIVREATHVIQPARIPTGVFLIDFCLLGGIPVSRGTMLIGKKHSGKTTLASLIASNAQRMFPDKRVVVVDVEGTFDIIWAEKLGVDIESLLVVQPESGEAAADIVEALIRTWEVSMVIVDSVAALVPMKEIESSAEDVQVGLQARLLGSLLRKTTSAMLAERARGHLVTPVYINQYRAKIGGPGGFGEQFTTPGGMALGFANTVEIIVRNWEKTKSVNGVDRLSHNEHTFKIDKNKLNAGIRTGEFRLNRMFDEKTGLPEGAVDDGATMISFAAKFSAYSRQGKGYLLHFWDEEHTVSSAEEAVRLIYNDGELFAKLKDFLIWNNAKECGMPDDFLSRFTEPYGL